MLEHGNDGAVGLVLNRINPLQKNLYIDTGPASENKRGVPIYLGGPLQGNRLSFLHTNFLVSEPKNEILPGIYWGTNKQVLEQLLLSTDLFHVYAGYASWGPNQLENEIRQKAWIISPAIKKLIFTEDPQKTWRSAIESKGVLYTYFIDKVKNPYLN